MWFAYSLSHFIAYLSISLRKSFTDILILIKCNLSTSLTECGFGSILRPVDLPSDPEGFCLYCFLKVILLYIQFCDPFWVNFYINCVVQVEVLFYFFFANGYPIATASLFLKKNISPLSCFCTFVKNKLNKFVYFYYLVLYYLSLLSTGVILPVWMKYWDIFSR